MIIANDSLQGQIETAEYKHHKSLMTKILGKFFKIDTESWAKFWGEKKEEVDAGGYPPTSTYVHLHPFLRGKFD